MKQLSEQQLKDAAAELDLDLEYVTTLHGQALEGGGFKSLEEFKTTLKEAAEKEGKGKKGKPFGGKKAKPYGSDEDMEEEEAEEEEEKAKSKAKELITGLDAEQRTVLKEMLEEAEEADRDPLEELRDDVDARFKELSDGQVAMAGALAKMAEAMTSTTKETPDEDAGDLRQIVEEIMSMSPRRQAARFASKEADATDDGVPMSEADKEILAKLKEIEVQVKGQGQPFGTGGDIYNAFTSSRLNPPA